MARRPLSAVALLAVGALVAVAAALPCAFDMRPDSEWSACDCQPVAAADALRVFCRRVAWLTVPPLAPPAVAARLTSLSIVESGLVFLSQDSFSSQTLQLLDLSHNQIETVNVNAFRGLEVSRSTNKTHRALVVQNKLYQLSLNHNVLSRIPSTALTYLFSLKYLHLQDNRIERVDERTFQETQLKNLKFLHLDDNQIRQIPTGAFTRLHLEVVTFGNNKISSIQPDAFPTTLWHLGLKGNTIDSIPYRAIENLINLSTLDLSGNDISAVYLDDECRFEQAMRLDLSNNRIVELGERAFACFKNVQLLDLSYNQISHFPATIFSETARLETLDLSHNRVRNIADATLVAVGKSLRSLNLADNHLHRLPPALRHLRVLERLDARSNKLAQLANDTMRHMKQTLKQLLLGRNSLERVPTDALHGMRKLEHLDLSKNRIERLARLAFGKFDGAGTTLVRLNLAANRIAHVSEPGALLYMSALAYLDLSHNRIEQLAPRAFSRLTGLEALFLQHNRLPRFPTDAIEGLHKLRVLVLDSNRIAAIQRHSLAGLGQLERLSMARNRLHALSDEAFPGDLLPRLKTINLARNRLLYLASRSFAGLPALEHVDLTHNALTTLHTLVFFNNSNLRRLDLGHNLINRTYQRALDTLPRLSSLSLAHNRLGRLERGTLTQADALEHADLSNNGFTSFDAATLGAAKKRLRSLDLSANELTTVDLRLLRGQIQALRLDNNNLKSIDKGLVISFHTLRLLSLSNNGLVNLDADAFEGCPLLTDLTLHANYLTEIKKSTFAHQEVFARLNLADNAIETLPTDAFGLDNLHRLNLSGNRLSHVPFGALNSVRKSLSELDLGRNRIAHLEARHLDGLRNISTLSLRHNHIRSIERAAFNGLHKLRHLDLSHNPVTNWHPNAFKELSHSIQTLNLADTGLYSVPSLSYRSLIALNLSLNRIYELRQQDVQPLSKLHTLDLYANRLTAITLGALQKMSQLKHLNISHNRISVLSANHLRAMGKLQSLRVHDSPLLDTLAAEKDFRLLRHLRELSLYAMPAVRFINTTRLLEHLPPLRSLRLETTDATLDGQLHAADCRLLRHLHLSGRALSLVRPAALQPIRGYDVHLAITDTSLRQLPAGLFYTLDRVSYLHLDLRRNRLDTLQPFPYTEPPDLNQQGTVLASIDLRDNPLVCDCRLGWLHVWRTRTTTHAPFDGSSLAHVDCPAASVVCDNAAAATLRPPLHRWALFVLAAVAVNHLRTD